MTTTHPDIQLALAALQRAAQALLADGADIITAQIDRARGGKNGYTAEIHIYPGAGVPEHLATDAIQKPLRYRDGSYDTEYSVAYRGARVYWLKAHWPMPIPTTDPASTRVAQ